MDIQSIKDFMSSIKESVESFLAKLNLTSSDIIQFVSCFGIGFLVGLFLKRYVKYFIIFVLCATLLLAVLQYFDLIIINTRLIKSMLGFSQVETFEAMMNRILFNMRIHAIEIGFVILGCLLGFKVG